MAARVVPGPWEVTLAHVNGKTRSLTIDGFEDQTLQQELVTFAGTITYSTTVTLPRLPQGQYLDLGLLHDVSELTVNGHLLGARWFGQHSYDLQDTLIAGKNLIVLRVTTTLGNYMQTLHDNATARIWTEKTPVALTGLSHPVRIVSGSDLQT